MILYFSGTGNSEYAAFTLAEELDDDSINLFEKIRQHDYTAMTSNKPWIIAAPTYAWRIPHIVEEWLLKTELYGNQNIYFILTCGGSIGNASAWLKKLCNQKNLKFCGCEEVIMPENYIALFSSPDKQSEREIIKKAKPVLSAIAQKIHNQEHLHDKPINLKDKLCSGPVNTMFYQFMVKADKFYVTEECIKCRKCAMVCPLNNIQYQNGLPVWGSDCTHCMACISKCPTEAIEYGRHTKGLRRYTYPKTK